MLESLVIIIYQYYLILDWKGKIKRSVINNLVVFGIIIVVGIAFVIYLVSSGNNLSDIAGLFAALANGL